MKLRLERRLVNNTKELAEILRECREAADLDTDEVSTLTYGYLSEDKVASMETGDEDFNIMDFLRYANAINAQVRFLSDKWRIRIFVPVDLITFRDSLLDQAVELKLFEPEDPLYKKYDHWVAFIENSVADACEGQTMEDYFQMAREFGFQIEVTLPGDRSSLYDTLYKVSGVAFCVSIVAASVLFASLALDWGWNYQGWIYMAIISLTWWPSFIDPNRYVEDLKRDWGTIGEGIKVQVFNAMAGGSWVYLAHFEDMSLIVCIFGLGCVLMVMACGLVGLMALWCELRGINISEKYYLGDPKMLYRPWRLDICRIEFLDGYVICSLVYKEIREIKRYLRSLKSRRFPYTPHFCVIAVFGLLLLTINVVFFGCSWSLSTCKLITYCGYACIPLGILCIFPRKPDVPAKRIRLAQLEEFLAPKN